MTVEEELKLIRQDILAIKDTLTIMVKTKPDVHNDIRKIRKSLDIIDIVRRIK